MKVAYANTFKNLGGEITLPDALKQELSRYVYHLYGLTIARYQWFKRWKYEEELLPPNQKSLNQQALSQFSILHLATCNTTNASSVYISQPWLESLWWKKSRNCFDDHTCSPGRHFQICVRRVVKIEDVPAWRHHWSLQMNANAIIERTAAVRAMKKMCTMKIPALLAPVTIAARMRIARMNSKTYFFFERSAFCEALKTKVVNCKVIHKVTQSERNSAVAIHFVLSHKWTIRQQPDNSTTRCDFSIFTDTVDFDPGLNFLTI